MYKINNYQNKKTFSSFLSGIAGVMGVPMWGFYVNRGQAITSIGTRDKNGAIMEFFPANQAYMYTQTIGFRTFIKVDGIVYEFFSKANENQNMEIYRDKLIIKEYNPEIQIKLVVTYYNLVNEKSGGLIRRVKILNKGKNRKIELIDGLAQILPAGIDYGGYKAVSNLLQSWMQVETYQNTLFFKLRGSTDDTSEVKEISDGNYYLTKANQEEIKYIYDNKIIFGNDTSLKDPVNFTKNNLEELLKLKQTSVNQLPSAFTAFKTELKETLEFVSLIGYTSNKEFLKKVNTQYSFEYLVEKQHENEKLHNELTKVIETKTSFPLFDEYMKQNYLDNVLRGGKPLIFETKNGITGYHIYSRKHGDLERDYNFFSIEPKYYSQGNGNFRDVLQNRRNDLLFNPELYDSNIYQFASLIQADGYNPLSIEGLKFIYKGKKEYPSEILSVIKDEYTPGELATILDELNFNVEKHMKEIIKSSIPVVKASFGEGYWEDHFTYLFDVLDSLESIYPDKINSILFDDIKYKFYNSNIYVKPRNEKYVMTTEGKIRQYDSIEYLENKGDWLTNNNEELKVNLIGKLVTLIVNKYAHLDPYSIGLSYEANKPGWNDAMNGLPGIFSSGVSETIELLKLTERTYEYLKNNKSKKVLLLNETKAFINSLSKIKLEDDYTFWDERMTVLEEYRLNLKNKKLTIKDVSTKDLLSMFEYIIKILKQAVNKAKTISEIIPTYLSYEVEKYEVIKETKDKKYIRALKFKLNPIATFLEGPTRLLKIVDNKKEALSIYNNVKKSELRDKKFKFYKTSVDLTNESPEIGRIHAFTKGWLERESNFLHMTYKYLYQIIDNELYEEFFEEIKTNYTCFMDPEIYGRSPVENSSFIAPSNNPDERKHGQGFVSRLSGSTAEMLSMWSRMFFGKRMFILEDDELVFEINPSLHSDFFKDNKVETTLFSNIRVVIMNDTGLNTYDKRAYVESVEVIEDNNSKKFKGNKVTGEWALKIRRKSVKKIKVVISKEEKNEVT